VILLSEYHASSIRLRRVILLRSDIWLTPSGIRFTSFRANRISLPARAISLIDSRKRESLTEFCFRMTLPSVLSPVSNLFYKCIGLRPSPYLISPIRTSLIKRDVFFDYSNLFDRFKIGGAVLAERTDEVLGKLLALVNVTADLADVAFFVVCFWLRLYVFKVIAVCHGLNV